jgi:cytochrome P450
LTYVDGIALVVDLLLTAAFVPASILQLPFMPQLSKKLGQAMVKLPDLAVDILDQERKRSSSANSEEFQNTIITTLVCLSDQCKAQDDNHCSSDKSVETGSNKQYLTEEEIAGNLFTFTVAGFDNTSNTMSYAICLLAAYPEWQAWIKAEIDVVLGAQDNEQISMEDYKTIFPKLTRCLAVMFETLRLYPAVSMLIRTIETNQTIFPSNSKSDLFVL